MTWGAPVIVLFGLVVLAQLADQSNAISSYTYPPSVVEVDGGQCLTAEEQGTQQAKIYSEVRGLLKELVITPCGPGWKRVAFLNMSNATEECPSSWMEPLGGEVNGCGRQTSTTSSCDSVSFPTGMEYTEVCGRVLGHQYRQTDAFGYRNPPASIDEPYVDGVSVTHGTPRQHIWSFACAFAENYGDPYTHCPCDSVSAVQAPAYVGDNYFCETGFVDGAPQAFGGDPLWDGEGCTVSACCTFNSPPWFSVSLATPTNDDLEVRICGDEDTANEDVYIELVELYVK